MFSSFSRTRHTLRQINKHPKETLERDINIRKRNAEGRERKERERERERHSKHYATLEGKYFTQSEKTHTHTHKRQNTTQNTHIHAYIRIHAHTHIVTQATHNRYKLTVWKTVAV